MITDPRFAAVAVCLGVALSVLALFVVLRGVFAVFAWIGRRFRKPGEPLIADNLSEHLAALQPPASAADRLDRFFLRLVGRSSLGLTGSMALAYLFLATVAAFTAMWLWRDLADEAIPAAVVAAVVACVVVLGFFWVMHRLWMHRLQAQLPDTFHLLARSLRAGLTVDQSVELIGDQGEKPLAEEFRRCGEHLRLGLAVPAAFKMTADRLWLADFDLLVALVTLHRRTGGNLALLVDRLAATVRARNQFRGQLLAITALGRLTGTLIALAGPVFLLIHWWTYPDYLGRMASAPEGVAALATAAVLEVIGVVWLLWLLRSDT